MYLIDTHVHLADDPLANDIPGVLARARAEGVVNLVVPGADMESSRRGVALAGGHDGVYAAVGVHPLSIGPAGLDRQTLDELAALAVLPGVVAIGEAGLDGADDRTNLDAQEAAFRAQAALARDLGLPLIIHCRRVFQRLVTVLESLGSGGPGGVLHAFGGSPEIAEQLARLGFLRGVGGGATREEAVRLRAALVRTPLETIVLETDAPYIGMASKHPRTVEPADLPAVVAALATLKGIPPQEVADVTTANARRLFRLPDNGATDAA
jgi:TatD DNase family protein